MKIVRVYAGLSGFGFYSELRGLDAMESCIYMLNE